MILSNDVNYIVSGLPRSGTSMLMQALYAAMVPTVYDLSRKPDVHNPHGYFELFGGKIINKMILNNPIVDDHFKDSKTMDTDSFSLNQYKGKFVKIIAYGLGCLPAGKYKIIYIERDMEEVLDSMGKMAVSPGDYNKLGARQAFMRLNKTAKALMKERNDIESLVVNYNTILEDPADAMLAIRLFLELPKGTEKAMARAVDPKLYRNRNES